MRLNQTGGDMKEFTIYMFLFLLFGCERNGTRVLKAGTEHCPNNLVSIADIDKLLEVSGELNADLIKVDGVAKASMNLKERIEPLFPGQEKINTINTYVYTACITCNVTKDKEFCKSVFKDVVAKMISLESDEELNGKNALEKIDMLIR